MDTKGRQDALYKIIKECISFEQSWVSVFQNEIVGFILVKADELERFEAENLAVHILYVGVVPEYRQAGIFSKLIFKVMNRNEVVTAIVKNDNKSDMAYKLRKRGFKEIEKSASDQKRFKWISANGNDSLTN